MLLQIKDLTIEQIAIILAALLIVTAIGYLIKVLLTKSVDRYFATLDKRDSEIEKYTILVNGLINKVDNLITEFRSYQDVNYERSKKISYQIGNIEGEMVKQTTIEKEHYNEVKGKLSKTNTRISTLSTEIEDINREFIKLKAEHNHSHGRSI